MWTLREIAEKLTGQHFGQLLVSLDLLMFAQPHEAAFEATCVVMLLQRSLANPWAENCYHSGCEHLENALKPGRPAGIWISRRP